MCNMCCVIVDLWLYKVFLAIVCFPEFCYFQRFVIRPFAINYNYILLICFLSRCLKMKGKKIAVVFGLEISGISINCGF